MKPEESKYHTHEELYEQIDQLKKENEELKAERGFGVVGLKKTRQASKPTGK